MDGAFCGVCGACWSRGEWTVGCKCCGGGALDRACVQCGGLCDARARKAVTDSNDFELAHWHGGCHLAEERRGALVAGLVRAYPLVRDDAEAGALAAAARASMPPPERALRRGDAAVREPTPEARAFGAWLEARGVGTLPLAWLEDLWSTSREPPRRA